MLREADTNGDGRISRDEFNDLLKVSPFFHAAMSVTLLTLYDSGIVVLNRHPRGSCSEMGLGRLPTRSLFSRTRSLFSRTHENLPPPLL